MYAIAVLVLVAAAGTFLWKRRATSVQQPNKAVAVLVADFVNHTGDPVFDGTLEPVISTALEGASFINAFNRGDARKAAAKLPTPSNKLDDQTATLVAA